MISAQGGVQSGLQYYTYDAGGQRVRRKVEGVETWQIFGMDGESARVVAVRGFKS